MITLPHRLRTAMKQRSGWFSRIAKVTGLAIAGGLAAMLLATIIFWDADFYSTRERWEHFKLAMFGDWQAKNWCPPGRKTTSCETANDFERAFSDVDDFNFFQSVPVTGTSLMVVTGAQFATAKDVLSGNAEQHWCYLNYGAGAVKKRLNLGTQKGQSRPAYAELTQLSTTDLSEMSLDTDQLAALARSHCRLGIFNQLEDSHHAH